MSVEYKDYYVLLGVDRKAPKEEISRAFKKLARKYHPDLNPDNPEAEKKFKEINEAYEVLKDPEKRRLYDQLGPNWKHGQDFQPPPGYERQHFRGGGPGGFGGAEGFSDFFETIFGNLGGFRDGGGGFGGAEGFEGGPFGGAGAGYSRRPRRGSDVEAELELTLEEAYRGGSKTISLQEQEPGRPARTKNLDVNIPAGVRDRARIRLSGQGNPGMSGGQNGDLYLRVKIKPHSLFKLEGNNVVLDLPLAPWEAALGTSVKVPTLDRSVELNVPAGISSGQKMRLSGRGLGQAAKKGDQLVRVMIKVPKDSSEEEKELWEKLAEKSEFKPRMF